jgi:ubiquinone/menaquinone biosynthesis C-methylase UbiE
VDAAGYRTAQAQSRESVNGTENIDPSRAQAGAAVSGLDASSLVPAAEGYERWASTYDHDPNPLLAREERYLSPLLLDVRGKRILDLACGTGRWLEKLMARGGVSGVGIDCSFAMLRVAKNKDAVTGRVARAGCESLPLRTAYFDLAICSFALAHIGDLGSMVRELARVTMAGADVFVSDLHPDAYTRGWGVGFRDKNRAMQIETVRRSIEAIVSVFRANGFECMLNETLWLGSPEQRVFEKAGKAHIFADASQVPAVLICHFRRLASQADVQFPRKHPEGVRL